MREDKEMALKLRLKGYSYKDINRRLGVPKSTLSTWLAKLELSPAKRALIFEKGRRESIDALVKHNQKQTDNAVRSAQRIKKAAAEELDGFTESQLLFTGVALYWAEGYKRAKMRNGRTVNYHPVSLTNSDPDLIKVFLLFLRSVCAVPDLRIKISLRYFQHQNPDQLLAFWKGVTKLPLENFGKPLLTTPASSKSIRPYNQLPYGVVQIRVSDTALFYKIMGWIEGLKKIG